MSKDTKSNKCVFCQPHDEIILENELAYALFDRFPVSKGHALVIPKRHVADFFDLQFDEQTACLSILNELKRILDEQYDPDGYNIGVNVGRIAGQSIHHVHIHLIPRYKGDVKNPLGGVRNVIVSKADYITKRFLWKKD